MFFFYIITIVKYFNRLIIHQTLGLSIEGSCDGTYNSNGYLMSPNYPQDYENNLDCRWTMNAPVGNIIKLNFLYFHTESSDKLYVYDGANVHGQLLETISGLYSHPFVSKANNINLKFATIQAKRGFRIKVDIVGKYTQSILLK